ncbi:MAG: diacylglycerol kinase family lipid kinase [Acidobacteria bacterium]|nr:diacylglycerol kinase family lipid kinase [Acidobacteriota bacterium]
MQTVSPTQSSMGRRHLAIINPSAGGGRCGQLAAATLERLRSQGVAVETLETRQPGDAIRLAREGYGRGFRRFLAAGGDGTSYEVVNGLFSRDSAPERVCLGFVPLGTGNSFLRDFTMSGVEHAIGAIIAGRSRPCDVIRLTHRDGILHYINLMSVGFTAEAGELTNRRFKPLGEAGYLAATLLCWLRLHFPIFPLRLDGAAELDQRPCTYLTFSNSRFTGGKLMIAPFADTADGFIEVTRVGPIGRWDFARTFPKIFTGAHMRHPLISHIAAKRVDFQLPSAVDVMIDGEIIRCQPQRLEVLPSALDVIV